MKHMDILRLSVCILSLILAGVTLTRDLMGYRKTKRQTFDLKCNALPKPYSETYCRAQTTLYATVGLCVFLLDLFLFETIIVGFIVDALPFYAGKQLNQICKPDAPWHLYRDPRKVFERRLIEIILCDVGVVLYFIIYTVLFVCRMN